MNVVLDTNLLVSALLSPGGVCERIIGLVAEKVAQPFLDHRILEEHRRVLMREDFTFGRAAASELLESFIELAVIESVHPLDIDLPDPEDQPFLEVAAAHDAILVTGNRKHFPPEVCGDVRVMMPAELLDAFAEQHPWPE